MFCWQPSLNQNRFSCKNLDPWPNPTDYVVSYDQRTCRWQVFPSGTLELDSECVVMREIDCGSYHWYICQFVIVEMLCRWNAVQLKKAVPHNDKNFIWRKMQYRFSKLIQQQKCAGLRSLYTDCLGLVVIIILGVTLKSSAFDHNNFHTCNFDQLHWSSSAVDCLENCTTPCLGWV